MMSLDAIEHYDYVMRNLFEKARKDSAVTGDRFVPACLGSTWGVVDAHFDRLTESGLSFEVALDHAERFSRLDKTEQEKLYRFL